MRYRQLGAEGDYQFGRSGLFLINSPAAVAQAIKTRLKLWTGEWFLDSEEGTPYATEILGTGTSDTRDLAVRSRILDTVGVKEITDYSSSMSPTRQFVVSVTVATIYGSTSLIVEF